MTQLAPDKAWKIFSICIFMSVLYFLAYGLFGFCDTDQGFIPALSYRILQGENIYQDFLYVRPPLTPYLHAFTQWIFPHKFEMLGERLLFYVWIGLSVYFSTRTLQRFFDFREIGLSPELFAIMAFVCSVHNFPPMAWHTVDGILFASLGIYFLTFPDKQIWPVLGLICMWMAAMCKQAFYPLLITGPVLLFFLYEKQKAWRAILPFLVLLGTAISVIAIALPAHWQLFKAQTLSAGNWEDLLEVGLIRYAEPFLVLVLPLLIVWRAQVVYAWKYLPAGIFGLAFWGLLGLHVYKALTTESYIAPAYGFSQAFFLLAVGVSLKGFWINQKAYATLLAMLMLSWCVGISWGYSNPMLYFTPILFGFIYILYEELDFSVPRYFYGIMCILLVWIFASLYQYPYRDAPREQMQYRLGELTDGLKGIRTGPYMFEKTEELLKLSETYGPSYTVLPSFPIAHYLTQSHNPLTIDWAHTIEAGSEKYAASIQKKMNDQVEVVFLENDKISEFTQSGRYHSHLARHVYENWQKVDSSKYFWVYKPIHSVHTATH